MQAHIRRVVAMSRALVAVAAGVVALAGTRVAEARPTVNLNAVADTTIYSDATSNSNGLGAYMHAGRTNNGATRRALVRFDVSSIPAGSTITAVSLRLNMSRTEVGAMNFTVHRLNGTFGEGTSNAPNEEGGGAAATAGDATWIRRVFNTTSWTANGGDFVAGASATTSVNAIGNYTWSGATMVSDVQGWVDNASTNRGWIVRGPENVRSAKRFGSRQNGTSAQRPLLTVTYTAPAVVGACCLADGTCFETDSTGCASAGGTYSGNGTDCTPNPCPQPTGACCTTAGNCNNGFTEVTCNFTGGTWAGPNTLCSSTYCSPQLTPFVDPLPILETMTPTVPPGANYDQYQMNIQEFAHQFHSALPVGVAWGVNGRFPGPTIVATKDREVKVNWKNDLRFLATGVLRNTHYFPFDQCLHGPDITGRTPVTVIHLHGIKAKADSDGLPDLTFPPGQSVDYSYPNDQRGATLWYHDHALGLTRLNVYMGIAGAYVINDPALNFNLPQGHNDIPLIIQDRLLNANGTLRYHPTFEDNFFGDKMLVNGKVWPYLDVRKGKYRFRLVNGCNSRTLTLSFAPTNLQWWVIASDHGLLSAPVPTTSLTMQPGERYEIVVDFAPLATGATVTMFNSAAAPFPTGDPDLALPNVMRFNVTASAGDTDPLPASFNSIPPALAPVGAVVREWKLRVSASNICGFTTWLIDDLLWHDITDFVPMGTTEIWEFPNFSGFTHPMHIHLVSFRVLNRQAFNNVNGTAVPTGPLLPPLDIDKGWKDTVQCPPNQITRVVATFNGYEGDFPIHCHLLEHEDHEMMRQFRVFCTPLTISQQPASATINQGDSIDFEVLTTGTTPNYQWTKNGANVVDGVTPFGATITGAQTKRLKIVQAHPTDNAYYQCLMDSPCDNEATHPALLIVKPACLGDLNFDGAVNTADLTIFLGQFGSNRQPGTGADLNADGTVNTQDLTLFLGRFGQPCAP